MSDRRKIEVWDVLKAPNKWNNVSPIVFLFFLQLFIIVISFSKCLAIVITIDPGHSISRSGALSCSGIKEVYFNDNMASVLALKLQKKGYSTRITRKENESPSLIQRAAMAKGSDVLISIHHDSVQPQFLEKLAGNRQCSNHANGYSIFISRKNTHFDQSRAVAVRISTELRHSGFTPSLHHAEDVPGENRQLFDRSLGIYFFDDLVVLKKAPVAAILIEAFVIVNPADEGRAADPVTIGRFSEAIATALTGGAIR